MRDTAPAVSENLDLVRAIFAAWEGGDWEPGHTRRLFVGLVAMALWTPRSRVARRTTLDVSL